MTARLEAAIERLRETFARYPARAHVEGCPCCVRDADARELARGSMRDVPDDLLRRYAFKAMTTWGGEEDFKHFLPEIFTRLARRSLGINEQIVYGKLPYAGWEKWPERERSAIAELVHAWAEELLTDQGEAYRLVDVIECAGLIGVGVQPIVDVLETNHSPQVATAVAALAQDLLDRTAFKWTWWTDDREQLVATWIRAHARERLESAFFAWPEHPDAKTWAETADVLRWMEP